MALRLLEGISEGRNVCSFNNIYNNEDYVIDLSAIVHETISWLQVTTRKLSELGLNLHHPHPTLRTPRQVAKSAFEIIKADSKERLINIGEFLVESRAFLTQLRKDSGAEDDLTQYYTAVTKYNTTICERRSHKYSLFECDCVLSDNKQRGLSFIEGERERISFAEQHLVHIEQLWKLLRVQIKILTIQLCSREEQTDSSEQENDLGRDYSANQSISSRKPELSDESIASYKVLGGKKNKNTNENKHNLLQDYIDCCTRRVRSYSDDCISVNSDNSTFVVTDIDEMDDICKISVTEDGACSTIHSEDTSPRDDGYFSKTGESAAEEMFSNDDTASADVDPVSHISCDLNKLSGRANDNAKVATSTRKTIQIESKHNEIEKSYVSTDVGYNSEEWDEIYEVVERFSQNTMTLLSWIDELKDISRNEENYFFDSRDGRKDNVICHIKRVYDDVKCDAAILLRNLSSEKVTILSVLQKVELQCDGFAICDPGHISDLSAIEPLPGSRDRHFLSSKLKNDLSALTSYEEFQPGLTSSPRQSTTYLQARNPRQPRKIQTNEVKPSSTNRAGLSSHRSSIASRRNWNDFVEEYKAVLEWLERMEMKIKQAEITELSQTETDTVFERYMQQFTTNRSMRENLNIKANYISTMYPQLSRDVHGLLKEIESSWNELKLRLCDNFSPFYVRRRKINARSTASCARDRHTNTTQSTLSQQLSHLLEYKYYFPDHQIEMSDFSLHQIRDRLSFEGRSRNLFKRLSASPERRRAVDPKESSVDLMESSRETSYSPRWTESVFAGSEIVDNFAAYRRKPTFSRETNVRPKVNAKTLEKTPTRSVTDRNARRNNIERLQQISYQGSTQAEPTDFKSSFISQTFDTSSPKKDSMLSDADLTTEREEGLLAEDCDQVELNPMMLSKRIQEFHIWLKTEEEDCYSSREERLLGWDPNNLNCLIIENQNRQEKLRKNNAPLKRILLSSVKVIKNKSDDVCECSLIWSCLMLEQRYHILILYCLDMECILERRLDVLAKNSISEDVVAHPLDGVWSDRGEHMKRLIETHDEDYFILFSHSRPKNLSHDKSEEEDMKISEF